MEQCCGDTVLGEFSKHLFQRDKKGIKRDGRWFHSLFNSSLPY
jgi:hypothetical protein